MILDNSLPLRISLPKRAVVLLLAAVVLPLSTRAGGGDGSDLTAVPPRNDAVTEAVPAVATGAAERADPGDGETTIERRGIVVGEVWLCAGQSNMQWRVRQNDHAEQIIAEAADPLIRLFDPTSWYASEPQVHLDAAWSACGPDTVSRFSAVAYFFGRELRAKLDIVAVFAVERANVSGWMRS